MTLTRQLPNGPGNALAVRAQIDFTIDEMERLATSVFQSKLFPNIGSPQAALTLMLVCQADGLHPMQAIRLFDVIEGKPVMKAAAIQARFQQIGGKVEMVKCDATEARAIFSHPTHQPKAIELSYTLKDAERAGLAGKKNWRENPADMLWWRLVSKVIRKIAPGIIAGISTPDEVEDAQLEYLEPETRASLGAAPREAQSADVEVIGYAGIGPDVRNYKTVIDDAITAVNHEVKPKVEIALGADALPVYLAKPVEMHGSLFNAATQAGLITEPKPGNLAGAIKVLDSLYKRERAWVREQIGEYFLRHSELVDAGLEGARVSAETEAQREFALSGAGAAAEDNVASNPADA